MQQHNKGLPTKIDPEQRPHLIYEGVEYQDFWTGSSRARLDALEHAIVRELLPLSGRRIIDIGCGFGRLADCYASRFKQIVMFDASISLLQKAYERMNGNAWFIAGDLNHLPFRRGSFDHTLMVRVFHHMPDSRACLSEIQRILCENGLFTFSYNNKRNIARIIAYMLRRDTINPFSLQPHVIGQILIRHHPFFVESLLRDVGFNDIIYRGAGVFDKIPEKLGGKKLWDFTGKQLAPFFGNTRLAPWIFCNCLSGNHQALVEEDTLEALLQCPSCGHPLTDQQKEYVCEGCKEQFPMADGILDLRPR